jgi:enterochelin esterase family protein
MSQAALTVSIPKSPKIRALVDAGSSALDAFWADIAAEGTPIVESNPEDAESRLVTFVWRADGPLENIVLAEWYSPGEPADKVMTRLGETDLWYRTLVMRSDLRGVYQFLLNDSLLPVRTDPNIMERLGRLQRDPLNPKRALPEPMWGIVTPSWGDDSVIELPDAPPLPGHAIRYDVPRGTVSERTFSSEHLGNERSIWIYTPAGFSDVEGTFPLLIQFDGNQCLDIHNLPAVLDSLIADGEIPPVVAVMVANVDRNTELPCNQAMADALAEELIPMLREEFRIAEGPESVIVAGQSYGGLAAAWVALRRPDAIGNAYCQSGSFWWAPAQNPLAPPSALGVVPGYGWLPTQVAVWPTIPVRFFMEAGLLEGGNEGVMPSLLSVHRHMRDVLIAKGYDVTYREYPGGHDFYVWRGLYPDGLKHLLAAS